MRRRSNSHSPISLFTFLDTLVCTMGSLILMLLAMTPKIRERAEARELARLAALAPAVAPVESEPEPEPEPAAPVAVAPPPAVVVPDRAEDEDKLNAERQRRHDAWNRSLAESREALKNKQAEYQRQRQLLKEAQNELQALNDQILKARLKTESLTDESQSLTERETELEEQQARIAQKIALTHKNLELLNRQQATAANEFALVPYDGNSGTARRPIYIECSKRGYRFLPEAETLNPLDLEGFREDFNPLLSGAQSLLRYWTMRRRESGGSQPQPYVLLLVRPSGVENYIIARSFLSSLDANFGYELIEEDWKLSVPAPDPLAKSILRQTLDMTVEAHHKVKDSLAELGQRGTFGSGRSLTPGGWSDGLSPGDVTDDPHGGPPTGKDSPDRRKPSVKFGPALRAPRDPSDVAQPGDSDDSAVGGSGSASDSGGATGAGNGRGTGTPPGTGTGGKAVASRPAGIGGGRLGVAGGGEGTGGPGSEIGDGGSADRGSANSNGAANGSQRPTASKAGGPGLGGSGSGTSGSGAAGAPDLGMPTGISDGSAVDSDSEASTALTDGGKNTVGKTTGDSNAGGKGGSGGRPGRGGARPATLGGTGAGVGGGSGDGNGDTGESLELPPEYTPGNFPGGRAGSDGFPLRSVPPDPGDAAGQNSTGSGGATSSRTRGSAARGSKTGSSSSGSTSSSAADAAAGDESDSDSASGNSSSGGSPLSPGQMGGPGAAIRLGKSGNRKSSTKDDDPDAGPRVHDDDAKSSGGKGRANGPRLWGSARAKATIGLERKLQIRLFADRVLIGWKDISVPVGNGETVEEMINQVVVGIDRAADRWGEPPTNFYWMPIIRFVIYPGGDQYYERLHGPLERKWGLPSTMEYAPDPKTVKKAAGGSS